MFKTGVVLNNLPLKCILCIEYFSFLERLRIAYRNESNNPSNRICDRNLKPWLFKSCQKLELKNSASQSWKGGVPFILTYR